MAGSARAPSPTVQTVIPSCAPASMSVSSRVPLRAAFAAREPALDILVNNAGAAWGESFDTFPEKGWDKVSGMLPVLICVGADDPCAEGEKGAAEGEKFLKSMGLVRTEHVSYEGMRHEIHNEIGHEQVYDDIASWIESHTS